MTEPRKTYQKNKAKNEKKANNKTSQKKTNGTQRKASSKKTSKPQTSLDKSVTWFSRTVSVVFAASVLTLIIVILTMI